MAFRGSFSRSLLAAARSSRRPSQPLPSRPPLPHRRRLSFATPRQVEELGCVMSLLPLHSVASAVRLTSYLSPAARACCELSQGT